MIGGMSRITQDVPPYMLVEGNPAVVHGINSIKLQRLNIPAETQGLIKKLFKILYREGLSTRQALEKIRAELAMTAEVEYIIKFIESSERGIVK
jgi:UDP-N-acetylglucosamine acyltransferase